ncbi:MAG: phage prohead protease, family [Spirosoma sp.]|nr:phage prohead protease, family [Spirosoma sp.]
MNQHLTSDPTIHCNTADLQGFKFALTDEGNVHGSGAVFGNIDQRGSRTMPGAFSASIAKHKREQTRPLMLWQHQMEQPVGKLDLVRRGRHRPQAGRQAQPQYPRRSRCLRARQSRRRERSEHGVRFVRTEPRSGILNLVELDLVETSIVSAPANPLARITGFQCESAADVERLLRAGGMSRAAATKIAAGGWPALYRDEFEPTPNLQPLANRLDSALAEFQTIKGLFR